MKVNYKIWGIFQEMLQVSVISFSTNSCHDVFFFAFGIFESPKFIVNDTNSLRFKKMYVFISKTLRKINLSFMIHLLFLES